MPHLSLRSPLPLHWAAFKKGGKKKEGEEDGNGDSVASPSAPPLPSLLCLCAFQSNTSCCCCFFCTLPDAAQGGWWRCKPPPHLSLPGGMQWIPRASLLFPPISTTLPPASALHLQQPLGGEQKQRSKTSSYLNKEMCKPLFLKSCHIDWCK